MTSISAPAPATVCPQLSDSGVPGASPPPTHIVFQTPGGSLVCLRLQFDVNRFWHFTRSHQSLLTRGGLTLHFATAILPSLLCSALMGLIKTGGILEWKLLFQYILFATNKHRNVLLLSLYQLYEPLEIRAIMR